METKPLHALLKIYIYDTALYRDKRFLGPLRILSDSKGEMK